MMKKLLKDKFAVICLIILLVIILLGIFAPFVSKYDPLEGNIIQKFQKPSIKHLLGTDYLGRDTFTRLIYGIRTTLFLSILTMVPTILLGLTVGIISGYFRGIVDEILMRVCDIMLSFPSQVTVLAIVGAMGIGIKNVIIANIVVKWMWYARMIRGNVIKQNNKEYILFSKTIGAKAPYIFRKHIITSILPELIILITLDIGWIILSISSLSFLGLGVQAPTPEWGSMLSESRKLIGTKPEQMLAPGLAILIVVAIFNLLGDSLRDAFTPKEDKE
ncbi:MAG: ABC transporter permease subunit [Leptotrichiaceae bacterium]|nr:ABC transporter permease subunit [Leptotrichiaceae bacterium]MBP6281076.1 ABC transporter permease subunit [Leptotrichiaceae bacterium]MBP7100633.1 ABC transporter permease subunit [Leptotrichiaceae bacterium]MBP7725500.1 ABC transporter permease subunit [Leptotrichiaceae bacterium]MBP9630224.1 ABC transporter permease subunit [Leptotrichiaceae bacterium]